MKAKIWTLVFTVILFAAVSGCGKTAAQETEITQQASLEAALDAQPRVVKFDMDQAAKDISSPRSSNMVLLGACAPALGIAPEKLEDGIRKVFGTKGEKIVEANITAFRHGLQAAQSQMK